LALRRPEMASGAFPDGGRQARDRRVRCAASGHELPAGAQPAAPTPSPASARPAPVGSAAAPPQAPRPAVPADVLVAWAWACGSVPAEAAVPLCARTRRFVALNGALFLVLERMADDERACWVRVAEAMSLRRASGDASLAVTAAPAALEATEVTYRAHRDALLGSGARSKAGGGGGGGGLSGRQEFEWAARPTSAGGTRFGSFEEYAESVLGDEGRMEFVRKRFYKGGALDSRDMMRTYWAG
jgi:uncharacterized membrane protein YgcG